MSEPSPERPSAARGRRSVCGGRRVLSVRRPCLSVRGVSSRDLAHHYLSITQSTPCQRLLLNPLLLDTTKPVPSTSISDSHLQQTPLQLVLYV